MHMPVLQSNVSDGDMQDRAWTPQFVMLRQLAPAVQQVAATPFLARQGTGKAGSVQVGSGSVSTFTLLMQYSNGLAVVVTVGTVKCTASMRFPSKATPVGPVMSEK